MAFDGPDSDGVRIYVVLSGMLLAFLLLGGTLWRVQVMRHSEFRSSMERQSIRRVRLPASRGLIYDRNGVILADNRPGYAIAIYIEELRQPGKWTRTVDEVQRVINQLADLLEIKPVVTRSDIVRHVNRRLPLPFLAWQDIDSGVLARWAEHAGRFPGVDLVIEPLRMYPHGTLASHVLGYVGRVALLPPEEQDNVYHYYLPGMEGKSGVEQANHTTLAGVAGGMLIRVDVSGFRFAETAEREPVSGQNLMLTLDVRIQQALEAVLANERGAGVVLDVRNGDVLAMASAPSFDPNQFGAGMTSGAWKALNVDPLRPLFNRAVSGQYPPGSTFKPVVALAALEGRVASRDTAFNCPGYFELGNTRFRCWRKSGHGHIPMIEAIEQSCNAFFCNLGMVCGHDRIIQAARTLGMGTVTGIGLPAEAAGLVPDTAWKRRVMRDGWRGGDTCNISIGQGALLVTPLQMAVMTAAIAGQGVMFHPRLVRGAGMMDEPGVRIPWRADTWRPVREGMRRVVMEPTGTAKRAFLQGLTIAGKTGTAEYGTREDRRKHTWMIAFAPYDDPRVAVAIVIEDGISGGITVAPRVRDVLAAVFGLETGIREEAVSDLPQEVDE